MLGVATRERPKGLRRLLDELDELDAPVSDVRVVVVDNDPAASAAGVVAGLPQRRWPVQYVHEPRVGIPHARNALLEAATSADFLAMIDDDEIPDSHWLVELERQMLPGVDAVAGPALKIFPPGTPEWLAESGGARKALPPTGTRRTTAATSNVLLRMETIRERGLAFDTRFPLMGGSDTWFFEQLTTGGGVIVWCREAVVHEDLPSTRVTVRWLLRRGFRNGYNGARRRRESGRAVVVARESLRAVFQLADGLRMMVTAVRAGRSQLLKGGIRVAASLGTLAGLGKVPFHEYRAVDGN